MDKVAFLFPGQGSQYIGMGKEMYESFPEARGIFDTAENILGWDIKKICFEGPEDSLKMTYICQPTVFIVSMACLEVLNSIARINPTYTAGLSLGEYSALVASGVLKFEDALRIVSKRAELMDEAARRNPGKMAAIIGLDRDDVKNLCLTCEKIEIANLNCPGQIVISGEKEAVDKAKELALQNGAKKALDLEVSGPFHSSLMYEAAGKFKSVLDERVLFKRPLIPVVSNVDAEPVSGIEKIKENLIRQLYSSVLWEDSIRFMISEGINRFYEIGPGKVLKGLLKRINPDVEVINIEKKEDIIKLLNC